MVLGFSVKMTDVAHVFGGPASYWYGKASTIPFAPAAGDLLDKGITISFLSAEAGNLTMALGISLEENGLSVSDPALNQLLFWAGIGWDGDVDLRGAFLLPANKLQQLEAALKRHHPYDMQLSVRVQGSKGLEMLDVSTGSSRKAFMNNLASIEAVETEFSFSRLPALAGFRM